MENATKALLIAAAVLVAILIISLGLAVYNKASNATDSADLSSAEIQAQNEKFIKYEGSHKRGSEVNALLETVLNSNLTTSSDGAKVEVKKGTETLVSKTGTSIKKQDTSKLYTITCTRGNSGVVTSITIKEEGTTTPSNPSNPS